MTRHLHSDIAHIPPHDEALLAWNARTFIPVQRGWLWWALAALLTAVAIGLGVYFRFWIAIPLSAMIFVFYILHVWRVRPRVQTIVLTDSGLRIDHEFIPYQQIDTFRTVYIPGRVSVLELRLQYHRHREIELEDLNPADVRNVLLHFVPEAEDGNDSSYFLASILKL